jgi:pSer/pThr/pTyr-binding forkhead associated (FHA) protein
MLRPGVLRLGRAEDNDLVLADVGVSRRHARIVVNEAGALIEDLGSGNGTILDGKPIRQHSIVDGDLLQIEPFHLQFTLSSLHSQIQQVDALSGGVLVVQAGEKLEPRYAIPPAGISIGRATDQTIVLHDPGSSRRHAVISVRQGGFWLEDNGSANGVFVNGTRVWQHLLQHNDMITIGRVELHFELEGNSQADPFSRIWDESGVWQRSPSEDGVAPFAMPPPRQPRLVDGVTEETLTATRPLPRPSSTRTVQSLSIIAGVFASLLLGGLVVAGWQISQMMEEPAASLSPPILLAAAPELSPEDALSVELRQVQGRALLAADRPMEAVLYFYQALKLSPTDPELKHLGAVACEEAVLGTLATGLRSAQVEDADKRGRYRAALRAARRPSASELPLVRTQLVEVLQFFPGDADLENALSSIDAALAAVALERSEQATALEGEAARAVLQDALQLSPTFEAVASIIAAENIFASHHARVEIDQAMRLELLGLTAEASTLYASAAETLPGDDLLLERLAQSRISALAR